MKYKLMITSLEEFLSDRNSASWEPVDGIAYDEDTATTMRRDLMSQNKHLYCRIVKA